MQLPFSTHAGALSCGAVRATRPFFSLASGRHQRVLLGAPADDGPQGCCAPRSRSLKPGWVLSQTGMASVPWRAASAASLLHRVAMTRESTPTRSRQRLAELRRRGTEDHRGHPGSAGDREDPCALGLSAGARGGPGLGALSPAEPGSGGAGLQAPAQAQRTHRSHIEAVTRDPSGMVLRAASVTTPAGGRRSRVNPGAPPCQAAPDVSGRASRRLVWPWTDAPDLGSEEVSGRVEPGPVGFEEGA